MGEVLPIQNPNFQKNVQISNQEESENGLVNFICNTLETLDFEFKKKRPRLENQTISVGILEDFESDLGIGKQNLIDARNEWPDYSYEEALGFVFKIQKEKNPNFESDNHKLVMKAPVSKRAAYMKTSFSNFIEICPCLGRGYSHVSQFIISELGTTGSIDKDNRLIVVGKFQNRHFESAIRKYIKEYIMCNNCKSTKTDLTKEARLLYLQCRNCGSKTSVLIMKKWFKAVVDRNTKDRLKLFNNAIILANN